MCEVLFASFLRWNEIHKISKNEFPQVTHFLKELTMEVSESRYVNFLGRSEIDLLS